MTDPGNQWDTLSTRVEVVEKIMDPPQILSIEADPLKVHLMGTIDLKCLAEDINNDALTYSWSAAAGSITANDDLATYTAPDQEGNYFITCIVSDSDQLTDSDSIQVMVRDLSVEPSGRLMAHYPLDGNAQDVSGNGNHGTPLGITWATDKEESPMKAAQFNGLSSSIRIPNSDLLNFQDALSIACWIKMDQFLEHEQHPVSHGSWQNRYKISIGDQNFRFTVNTSDGIRDLDSEGTPSPGQWHHLAVVYNKTDMEIWLDGKLDAFTAHSGLIKKTVFDLVFGQNLPGDNNYNFKGRLDALSIFDYGLSPSQIADHMENSINVDLNEQVLSTGFHYQVYPNPVTGSLIHIEMIATMPETISVSLFDLSGKQALESISWNAVAGSSSFSLPLGALKNGIYLLSITGKDWTGVELITVLR